MKRTLALLLPLLASCSVSFPSSSSSSVPSSESSEPTSSASSQASPVESSSQEAIDEDFHPEEMDLTFSDEFSGNALSDKTWDFDLGSRNGGWGNNELEYYTDHNHEVKDGELLIHAKKEYTVEPGERGNREFDYTSSRLVTRNKVSTTYGYICARIALPLGQGMWPAFWMLPEERYEDKGWPVSGEIDIMEAKGRIPNIASGALHYASNGTGGSHTYKSEEKDVGSIADYHVYAVLWEKEKISWYIDGENYLTVEKRVYNNGYRTGDDAPFNKPFHIILNLAVGGNFDGGRKPADDFEEAHMSVDYLRIYQ